MSIHALILAGGQGSRLGAVRKQDVRLGNMSLLQRVTGQLRDVGRPLLLSVGRDTHPGYEGLVVLPDPDLPIGGPMAGLVAAANYLAGADTRDVLVTVAVDTPFLPNDFVRRLVAALGGGAMAARAGWRGNFYPTNAVWRLPAIAALPELAHAGTLPNSPKALLSALDAIGVDWGDTHESDPFANLNTPGDLVALARRARAPGP